MQERLTVYYAKKNKSKNLKIILTVLISVFCLLGVWMFSLKNKNINNCFNSNEFYFVVVGEDLSEISANKYKQQIENYGGAGVLLDNSYGLYSVIIFAYNNEIDAQKIKLNTSKIFKNCYVECLKTSKINKKTQDKIKSISGVDEAITRIYESISFSSKLLFDYEKSNISFSELTRYAIAFSDKLIDNKNKLSFADDISSYIKASISMLQKSIDIFITQSIASNDSIKYFKKFCVQTVLEYIKIMNYIV